jgi:DNA-binding transcriptional ArsR family regulator
MAVESLLKTLAEPKRSEIVRLVWSRELAAAEIATYFPDVTRSAISQHLGVLRTAGLVTERRDGARRLYSANQAEMEKLREFLDSFWSERLDRLRGLAESTEQSKEGA